jgi:hypothetical protein
VLLFPIAAFATEGAVLELSGERLWIAPVGAVGLPGESVGLYFADPRPDPRTGALTDGLRYGGDARITWVGADLVELALAHPDQVVPVGARVVLDAPRDQPPTAAWTAPPPPAPAPVLAKEAWKAHVPATRLRDLAPGPPSALVIAGGTARDGFGTGAAVGRIAWTTWPARGPGRVEVAVDGVRGLRWVAPEGGDEPPSTEIAAGYAVWTTLETAGAHTAGWAGLGLGVGDQGLAPGLILGVRRGLPWADQVSVDLTVRDGLGILGSLAGQIALVDRLRIGLRARIGDLPVHDGAAFRQARADGALTASVDLSPRLALDVAGGLAGYDLAFSDAGIVADAALTTRFGGAK